MAFTYIPDEDLISLEDGDQMVNIKGFVDCVFSPKYVESKKEYLFKFLLSNGSKKIACLIWGNELIKKFSKQVSTNKVVHIRGGFCQSVSKPRNDKNLISRDIVIKEYTSVTFPGTFHEFNDPDNKVKEITFDDLPRAEGKIQIPGFIQNNFNIMHSKGGMSYGIGSITDGKKRITVQISCFSESAYETGDHVVISGTVKEQGSLLVIVCENMDKVVQVDQNEMPFEDVEKGVRPVKRVHN